MTKPDIVPVAFTSNGPTVTLANGSPFPRSLTARLKMGSALLSLFVEVVDGEPQLVRYTVEREPGGPPLQPRAIHAVPLGQVLAHVVETAAQFAYMNTSDEEVSFPVADVRQAGVKASAALRGRPVRDEDLVRVAAILQDNTFSPTKEIAETLHVSRRTAGRWSDLARARGLA